MKPGELYIVAGLETAAELDIVTPAYRVVSKLLPGRSAGELLRELARPRALPPLATKLGCGIEDVFRTLSDLAAREIAPPPAPRLTAAGLKQICSRDAQGALADVLGCRPPNVIDRLFDPEPLESLLRVAEIEFPAGGDTQTLYYRLAARTSEVEVAFGFGPAEWGAELDRLKWLKLPAEELLEAEARENGWDGYAPSEIVAAVVNGTAGRDVAERRTFDSLAVTELRRRAAQLAEDLRAEAALLALHAADRAPSELGTVARLPGWIELYERRSVVSGLKSLLAGETVLLRSLADPKAWQPLVVDDEPHGAGPLSIHEIDRSQAKTKLPLRRKPWLVTFEIAAQFPGSDEPRAILKATAVPESAYDHIAFIVRTLHGDDLSTDGEQLGEQLLNTRVPSPRHGLDGRLRAAVERHDTAFARALLLCGVTTPVSSEVAWKEHLATELPFAPRDPCLDARFPKDTAAIADDLRKAYATRGASLVDLR